ncbi:restriction endonuclease [Bacillus sp. CMF12]|uniref:restriction endonuclease n=1 Tax=Bacillaceae TaxID=186817 RepID=UPI001FB46FB6|nr:MULTISPECIES: restriction endonuclease [Bacillaceae]USK50503.1 restriction endonuclease [Bacillus sp. CMF12]
MNDRQHLILWIVIILVPIIVFINTNHLENTFLTFLGGVIFYLVYGLFWFRRDQKRQVDSEIWVIRKLSDEQLEDFTISLLSKLGYTVTKPIDKNPDISFLLTSPTGNQVIVKVKSHKREVGIRLIQKTLRQMDIYDDAECWVITNERFAHQAIEFAKANHIRLYDREQFIKWILKAKNEEKKRGWHS